MSVNSRQTLSFRRQSRKAEHTKPIVDAEAFGRLYARSHVAVFRYIYGLHGGPQADVEDLTAETFTRAWKARKRFTGPEEVAIYWLFRIARNLVIDSFRKSARQKDPVEIDLETIQAPNLDPEREVLREEQRQVLLSLLQGLPRDHREMVVLRYFLGWRVKDIGKYLDVPENTISVTLRRILKRIRQNLS